jgi:putative phage-type endonuclease
MATDVEQGSEEWHRARLGKVTASRVADVMARPASGKGFSATRDAYMGVLIAERLTGQRYEKFKSQTMARGNEVEDEARAAYAFRFDVDPVPVGFVDHPRIAMAGCSPDRFIGDDGLIEIKCPDTHTHISTLTGASINGSYVKQMQFQMACTGRAWCDFVSYDPRLPEHMSLFVSRVHRDDAAIREMEAALVVFLQELERKLRDLRERFEPAQQYEPMPVGMMP